MQECQVCLWTGHTKDFVAQWSGMEPGCPVCGSDDFLDWDDVDHTLAEKEG